MRAKFAVQGVALSEGEFGVPHGSGDLRRLKWETSPKRAFPWGGISKNLKRTSFRLRKLVGPKAASHVKMERPVTNACTLDRLGRDRGLCSHKGQTEDRC